MNSAPPTRLRAALAAATLTLLAVPSSLRAGGFALIETNAAGAGSCWSDAAVAQDGSTVFSNPAGLAWLQQPQVVGAAHGIVSRVRFTDAGSTTAGGIPLSGGDGGDAGGSTPFPNLYYGQPLTKTWAGGVGLTVPWGLSTDYADGWAGRYHALKSELKTVNLTAAASWRANERLAVGVGLQWQRASVELGNAVDFGLAGYQLGVPGMLPGNADGKLRVKGSDTAVGAVAGVLYRPQPGTSVGFSYRSQLDHSFLGDATFTNVPAIFAAAFNNQRARSSLSTPATYSLHAMQDVAGWRFTASATWWRFSSFRTLAIDFENPATPDSAQAQDWRNAGIYSVGAACRWSETLTFRMGAAINTSPVPDAARRTPRIPDNDRRWLSFGVSWQPAENLELHAGYVHLFFRRAEIANTDAFTHLLRGSVSTSADILSAQGTLRF